MKKHLLTLSLVLGFWFFAKAQYVTIPDAVFVGWMNGHGFNSCISGINGDQLDTTCMAIDTVTSLSIYVSIMHDITGIQYFRNLQTLGVTATQITFIPTLPNSLKNLYCQSNFQLTTISKLPDSLSILYVSYNSLDSLPSLPATLTSLNCSQNHIPSISSLPNSLLQLDCGTNQISTIPTLPNGLTNLVCNSNQLSAIPNLPSSLVELNCNDNHVTMLPTLPASLLSLQCGINQISSVPSLPNILQNLRCNNNLLSSLPVLPDSLVSLNCENNQLSSLPLLPSVLNSLECSGNVLTSLPILRNTQLSSLLCGFNTLVTLPSLPSTLELLYCQNNLLVSLPELPDNISDLDCSNNINLSCLPELKNLDGLTFANTAITCRPGYNLSANLSSYPTLDSLPVCDVFNNNGCQVFFDITGKVYKELNNNCIQDVNENSLANIPVKLYKNGVLTQEKYTLNSGYFSFDVDTGFYTYSIDTTATTVRVVCPDSLFHSSNITAVDSFDFNKDFGVTCKPGFDVGVWAIVRTNGIFRPANFVTVKIEGGDITSISSLSCATGISGQIQVVINGPASYVSPLLGSLPPTSVSGDTIIWSIADFGTVDVMNAFNIIVQTDTLAQSGQQVCFTVGVSPTNGDNNPMNNNLSQCFNVVNSYDPNEKEVSPLDGVAYDYKGWLTYTIHFQNTGNAPAEHIYVTDTLDANIDESSFQFLASSHQGIFEMKSGGILKFSFPNINLADSFSNEPQSHGWIQFRVKLKNNLLPNTIVENTAFIYFDFNSPVVTNTTSNTLSCQSNGLDLNASICNGETYIFNGNSYTTNTELSDTLQNIYSCDSVVTFSLRVWQPSSSSVSISVCDGEVYYVGNHAHNQSGIFTDTLQTVNGCDSVVQLSLTLFSVYQFTVDTSITQGNSYTLPSGNVVNTTGTYNDTLHTINNCDSIITTHLDVVSAVSPLSFGEGLGVRIFPNPAGDFVNVVIDKTMLGSELKITDVTGRVVSAVQLSFTNNPVSIAGFARGVYFITVKNTVREWNQKLIVE